MVDFKQEILLERRGISVHFSVWKYVMKKDKNIQCLDHPDYTNMGPVRTMMAFRHHMGNGKFDR